MLHSMVPGRDPAPVSSERASTCYLRIITQLIDEVTVEHEHEHVAAATGSSNHVMRVLSSYLPTYLPNVPT